MPPGGVIKALMGLHQWLRRLVDALLPAEMRVFEKLSAVNLSMCIGLAARFGLVEQLGDRRVSTAELARELKLNPDVLHRVLRCLASQGLFVMNADGTVQNNAMSRTLRTDNPMRVRESALYWTSGSNMNAWTNVGHSLRTGETAFDAVHGKNVWEWFDQYPDEREIFASAMLGATVAQSTTIATLFDFKSVEHVCDIGSGRGSLASELLIRFPHLKATLVDRPGVLALATSLLEQRGVSARATLRPGDFFSDLPAGQPCYLLKNILHDWSDADCLCILKNIRKGASPGARVLIFEFLLEPNATQGIGPQADMQMLVACVGGRERSRAEFSRLLTEAGFQVGRITEHPMISMIEGVVA